jgi:hypothetical protein
VIGEDARARRADTVSDHELLRECLARLELSGCGRRSVAENACGREPVDKAERLRIVHGGEVEVDSVVRRDLHEAIDVSWLYSDVRRDLRRACIPRRDKEIVHVG